MVYADVAMNIADEHNFFTVGSSLVPSQPLPTVVTEDNLQQCLEWQHIIAEVESPIEEPNNARSNAGSVETAPSSLPVHPSTELEIAIGSSSAEKGKTVSFEPPSYLNEEQSMAFSIVTEHLREFLIGNNPPQLLMVVHSQGGTGKTRLLEAITELFTEVGCADRLAKTALSGVAACQIGGKTLHSWGTLPAGKGMPRTDSWIYRPSAQTAT
jgi:hypothetical protein